MKNLILIAAIGKNNELGKNNDLIWKIKGDMKFFKEHTTNHHILMGKNTFISLPHMLPNRTHIVLTTSNYKFPEGVIVCKSLDDFYELSKGIDDDVYVIGGASIYKEMIDDCNEMYLTEIDDECKDADVYFPKFTDKDWDRKVLETNQDESVTYSHVYYKKNKEL